MTASSMPKKPTAPPEIPDAVVLAALEIVLKPLGTSLRHYEVRHKDACIEAMRGVLMAERERAATFVETMAVARGYAGGMIRGSDFVRRTNPSGSAKLIAAAIRKGEGAV